MRVGRGVGEAADPGAHGDHLDAAVGVLTEQRGHGLAEGLDGFFPRKPLGAAGARVRQLRLGVPGVQHHTVGADGGQPDAAGPGGLG